VISVSSELHLGLWPSSLRVTERASRGVQPLKVSQTHKELGWHAEQSLKQVSIKLFPLVSACWEPLKTPAFITKGHVSTWRCLGTRMTQLLARYARGWGQKGEEISVFSHLCCSVQRRTSSFVKDKWGRMWNNFPAQQNVIQEKITHPLLLFEATQQFDQTLVWNGADRLGSRSFFHSAEWEGAVHSPFVWGRESCDITSSGRSNSRQPASP